MDIFDSYYNEYRYEEARVIVKTYHHAQLTLVEEMLAKNIDNAINFLTLAIACRKVLLDRFNDGEPGHVNFYNKLVNEYQLMLAYKSIQSVCAMLNIQCVEYRFSCAELVENYQLRPRGLASFM